MVRKPREFEISENDGLRLTILGCFRYSLGRKTYMPSHTVEMIKEYREIFNRQDWRLFINEIEDCKCLGDNCDVVIWNDLKEFAKEMLKN